MTSNLAGRTVAFAEGRQADDLSALLLKEGATPLSCPLLTILDAPDAEPVVAWLRDLMADRFALVVFLTGEGLRRLVGFADRAGLRDDAIAAFGRVPTLTRGPKPGQALKEIGLTPTAVAAVPTTDGVIESLRSRDLRGQTVGVQLYAATNVPLTEFLTSQGAEVRTVLPYVYAPKSDAGKVVELIERLERGGVDAVVFTSSPQVDRLYEVAAEAGREAALRTGLEKTCIAAVGPVVADNLRRRGATVAVCPEQGWQMKNLVRTLARHLAAGEAG